jgi:hypothetical protein
LEPTDPPRPAAPSLLSGSSGKNDPAKDSGRILASLEKGPAIADTARVRKTPAAAPRPKVLPLLGAGIAVGVVIWFLSGHIQPPGTTKPGPQAAIPAPPAPAAAAATPAPATATIVSTAPTQPAVTSIQGGATAASAAPVPVSAIGNTAPPPAVHPQPEPLASVEAPGQPQRSPLAVLTDDDTDAAPKDKKAAHPHKKTDSDIRLIEALVSHVNGEEAEEAQKKQAKTRTARTASNADNAD